MSRWLFKISFFLLAFVNCEYYEERYQELLARFNEKLSNGGDLWEFGKNKYFENKSRSQILRLLGVLPLSESKNLDKNLHLDEASGKTNAEAILLPEEYDVRKSYPQCKYIPFIKDQSNCGSCWAVSSASVMSDRACIASNGTDQLFLSEEELLTCCYECGYGCDGGYPEEAFKYWQRKGVPTGGAYGWTNGCKPYSIKPCGNECSSDAVTPSCKNSCIKEYKVPLKMDRTHGSMIMWVRGVRNLMEELYKNGPLVLAFHVYEDFFYYKKGVYKHRFGDHMGQHAVRLLGWGVENNVKYWLIANSWNTTFGENGYFRILRGEDECGIESRGVCSRFRALK